MFGRDHGVDRPPFASPEEALRWFEWRRQARMLPVLALGGSLFLWSGVLSLLNRMNTGQDPGSTMLAGSSGLVAAAFVNALGITAALFGAYCFFQNQRLQTGPQKTFFFIRPVSTQTLATARLVVALRSTVVSMVPLVLACAVAVTFAARSEFPTGLATVVERGTGLGGVGIAVLLFCGLLEPFWTLICGIGTLILFGGCAYLFYMARQRDLVEKRNLLIAVAALPLLVVGFATLISWDCYMNGGALRFWPPVNGGMLALAVLPLASLATVPLFMHHARHR